MVQFIDDHKNYYGVEPICRALPIAPSTYHRAKDLESCPDKRSLRSQHDDYYVSEIKRIWQDSNSYLMKLYQLDIDIFDSTVTNFIEMSYCAFRGLL